MPHTIQSNTRFPSLHSFHTCIKIHTPNTTTSVMTAKRLRVVSYITYRQVLLFIVKSISILVVYNAFVVLVITQTHYEPMKMNCLTACNRLCVCGVRTGSSVLTPLIVGNSFNIFFIYFRKDRFSCLLASTPTSNLYQRHYLIVRCFFYFRFNNEGKGYLTSGRVVRRRH